MAATNNKMSDLGIRYGRGEAKVGDLVRYAGGVSLVLIVGREEFNRAVAEKDSGLAKDFWIFDRLCLQPVNSASAEQFWAKEISCWLLSRGS